MRLAYKMIPVLRASATSCLLACVILSLAAARQARQDSSEKPAAKPSIPAEPPNPAQIELLETKIRFDVNGDSRKEVHTLVRINSELGVRQFARLNFDYNRSFEAVEIPLVHITHSGGGTADILPSAITDNPHPAVVNYPAYHDVRVKSVRILGLQPSDLLEYRVITTTTHHPLAPDFWLDHSFDRTGVVSQEIFELDLPALPQVQIRINPNTPVNSQEKSGDGASARNTYRWLREIASTPTGVQAETKASADAEPDVALSTEGWNGLSVRLGEQLMPGAKLLERINSHEESMQELSRKRDVTPEIAAKAIDLTRATESNKGRLEALYDFVSQKITTIDLPLGATGFAVRPANLVLAAGYATPEDKFVLFAALAQAIKLRAGAALTGYCDAKGVPRPSVFRHLLISASDGKAGFWLDPSLEVAPFGMVSSIPQKCVFVLNRVFFVMDSTSHEWQPFDRKLPFAATQHVSIDATLAEDGRLTAQVHYALRGDNELLLRLAFHKTPKENWKDIAQLLSLSDGFRGQITSVNASDPYATHDPFTVDYEITTPKFVDWSKKSIQIPALLPQIGLPDPPAKPAAGAKPSPIELGTPLEVTTTLTLHLPPGVSVQAPTGTSVQRDYATFSSQYSFSLNPTARNNSSPSPASRDSSSPHSEKGTTITASRHINFLLRQILADRVTDFNAFLHAVQYDQTQLFTITSSTPK